MPLLTLKTKNMKKITLLAVALVAISFASCKKDYTCECTSTVLGLSATASTTIHDTKSKAKDACTAKNSSSTGTSVTCAIK